MIRSLPSGGALHTPEVQRRTPLLFLHGVGGGAWSCQPQHIELTSEFGCFSCETRGHGAAKPVADAGLADAYHDASEALRSAHELSGQRVVLAGHSMGGLIALALACDHPTLVRGVFLVDPVYAEHGAPPQVLPWLVLKLVRLLMSGLVRSYLRNGPVSRALSRLVFTKAFTDRAAMERAWQAQRTQIPLEHPRMLYESFEGVTGFPFRAFADVVEVPIYLLEAASKRPSRFAALAERLRTRLGDRFTYAAVTGGHYLQLDRPAEVTKQLADFVRSLDPSTSAQLNTVDRETPGASQ